MKRPKDMTPEELASLPEWPLDAEWPFVRVPVVTCFEPDDIAVALIDGEPYAFGQFDDGSWYRRSIDA